MKRIIILGIIVLMIITGCRSNTSSQKNKNYGNNQENNGTNLNIQGILSSEYYFLEEGICLNGECFSFAEWDNPEFQYTCMDFTCDHKSPSCGAMKIIHEDEEIENDSFFIYYEGKMIIFDTRSEVVLTELENGNKTEITYYTDVYEAKEDGTDRKLVLSYEGNFFRQGYAIIVDGKLMYGGRKNTVYTLENTNNDAINTMEVDNAIFAVDLHEYKMSEYEIDDNKEYNLMYLYAYEEDVYAVIRSADMFNNNELIDASDEKWYQISLEEKSCELINEVDDKRITFFGVINNKMYYSYWDNKILCREIGTDNEEVFLELDVDLPVATIYDGMIMVNTGLVTDGKNYDVEYTWFDEEKNIIKSHKYDEWLVVSNVLGNRIIYMKPYEEGIPYYWIDKDNVENLHKEGTYIGPM